MWSSLAIATVAVAVAAVPALAQDANDPTAQTAGEASPEAAALEPAPTAQGELEPAAAAQETDPPVAAEPPPAPPIAPVEGTAVILALTDTGGQSDQMFAFDLSSGGGRHFDRLDRVGPRLRLRGLDRNLFEMLGRSPDVPAEVGEIFLEPIYLGNGSVDSAILVESSTGWMAYLADVGRRDPVLGELRTLIGRPFDSLAAVGGQFSLFSRRNSTGQTIGAYLYHAASGRAVYLGGLEDLEIDPPVVAVEGLPTLAGRPSAAALLQGERSVGYVLAGNARLLMLAADEAQVSRLSPSAEIDLVAMFGAEVTQPTPQRFAVMPVQNSDDDTIALWLLDTGNGTLSELREPLGVLRGEIRSPRPRQLRDDLLDRLGGPRPQNERVLTLVPANASNGATVGAWIVDSAGRPMLFASRDAESGRVTLERVELELGS
ncbi:MAG: hypothetical protein AAGN46_02525 [Acidobacteriota bacterium]